MQNKESTWSCLTPKQKKNRIIVYSMIATVFLIGVLALVFKPVILGIFLCLVSLIAVYILWRLPKWIMRDYCEKAEKEYQLHKDDKDSDTIYLSGAQMYKFLHGEVVDIGENVRPLLYEEIFKEDK